MSSRKLSLEEMALWDAEAVHGAILADIPADWQFATNQTNGWHDAKILDGDGNVCWQETMADQLLLLLSAYSWLHLRNHKTQHPAWKPRTREVRPLETLAGRASHPNIVVPDPEDLDPDEVRTVYANPHNHRKR